ncbi:MAG: sulfate adenylyltransferase [Dehalococcoidia bacterium]|nr:sulfate adenylyltransferase [Dehalococcoidia bacterium]
MTTAAPTQTVLSTPHGGKLVQRFVEGAASVALRSEVSRLPQITLNARELSDAQLIAMGAFSPLEGFMNAADYRGVLKNMHLSNGLIWSVPVTLSITKDKLGNIKEGQKVALNGPDGKLAGVMEITDIYPYDKKEEARLIYKTEEEAHPGVANVYAQGELLVGGKITMLGPVPAPVGHEAYFLAPAQSREAFKAKGWKTVVGFQTRNPVHRAHEYIQKCAMEIVDGLFLHPLVGDTKGDDIPANVRMECYKVLLDNYYPKDRVILGVYPAFMRYAGPREAIFHAMARKNFGCTHFIVGRDHAGVGNYYGTYEAQDLLRQFSVQELGITPLFYDNSFWCMTCGGMATEKTCPHPPAARIALSGTQVRKNLSEGKGLPVEMSRPEVAAILTKAYAGK